MLNSINQLIFATVKCSVLFEVRTEFLIIREKETYKVGILEENEKMTWCMEAVVAYFETLSLHLQEGLMEIAAHFS
jgi:hypothetical protein